MEEVYDETQTRICLHCKESSRKPIKKCNFSRHIKEQHNNVYQEKKKNGLQRASGYEFQIDYEHGPLIKRQRKETEDIKSHSSDIQYNDQREPTTFNQDNSIISGYIDKSLSKSEFEIMPRKREQKAEQKFKKKTIPQFPIQAPKTSISMRTDLNSLMNTRLSLVEQEQQFLKQKVEKIEVSLEEEHSKLLKQILQFVQKDQNTIFQEKPTNKDIIIENNDKQFVVINDIGEDINLEKVEQFEEHSKQNNNNEGKILSQDFQIQSFQKQNENFLWQTWKDVLPNKTQPQLTGNYLSFIILIIDYKGCKTQGDRRVFYNKDGVKFDRIVKMLINILKYEPVNPGYVNEVSKQLNGLEICQGFKIKHVLGAGSVGTTVLAYDKQEDKDIALKIYHVQHSMTSGLREYQMLNLSQLAPSIVKVNSLMYNSTGQFLAISMEDLSKYSTVYNYLSQNDNDLNEKLKIARNIARAVAELHKIKIVHGDIASENILINSFNQDIKIIDFDISSKEGEKIQAAGNPDFITFKIQTALDNKKIIKSTYLNDIYALGQICYLILGDKKKQFYHSLSSEQIPILKKEKMILNEKYFGCEVVNKMITRKITAQEGALELNQLIRQNEKQ